MAWAAGRLDYGHALSGDVTAQVGRRGDAIFQIFRLQDFFQTNGDRLQVATGQAAIGRESFGENQEVGFLFGQAAVVGTQESADVGEGIFFCGEGAAVRQGEKFLGDFAGGQVRITGLILFDEPGIFGEAAGVEIERDSVALSHFADGFNIRHGDWLAAARIVGDGDHH